MAADAATINAASNENNQVSEEEKVDVGTLIFNVGAEDLDKIKEKIGDILQAQLILRGDNSLGYGKVIFSGPTSSNAEGDITGDARLTRGSRRGRGATRGRGARRGAGRTRRSADEQEAEEGQNGTSIVGGIVESVKNLVVGESTTTEGEKGATAAAGRGGKAKRGRGAKAPRAKRERGEPSKTLVFIRNLPFSYTEEQVGTLFSSNNLSYVSLSMPVWKFGPRKGKGRGYAFATVSSEEEQKKAIDTLNGKEIATGEMFTPRSKPAAEGAEASEPAAPAEPTERVLRLIARQGFENEEKNSEQEHEEEGAAAAANGTGHEDSGTA